MEKIEYYLLLVSGGLFLIACVLFVAALSRSKFICRRIGTVFTLIGFSCITLLLVARSLVSHRIPLSNMFEFGLFFLWSAIGVYLYIYYRYQLKSLGIIILPMATLMTLWLQSLEKDIRPLMPALNSNWLYFHVLTAIAAYGCFTVSFATALLYLIKDRLSHSPFNLPGLDLLDELTYKIICAGMPFLTLCIVTGAFWAENAWGTYWSWDPKETWSLITWLIYTGYLHARLIADWRGKRAACLAVAGFLAVIFTFLGVNLLLPGLHSYR